MTIAEVQAKNSPGSATATLSSGTGAGNTVFLAVYAYGSVGGSITAASPKVGGSAYASATQVLSKLSPGTNNVFLSVWMFPGLPSGATAFSVTVTGGTIDSNDGSSAWEFSGLGASPSVDRSASGSGTSGTVTSGSTAAVQYAPELVLGAAIGFAVSLTPPGSPWTGSEQPSSFCSGGYQVAASSGGTYSYTPSGSGNDWVAGVVTIAPAATVVSGAAALSGSGTLTAAALLPQVPAAALSGSGTLTAARTLALAPAATLSGSGTLTAAGGLPGALARDSSSPAAATTDDPGTQVATQVSNAFSPPAGSVLVVTAAAIESGNGNWSATPFAITDSLGSHLSWTLAADQYDNTAGAFDERFAVFWAYCPSAQTGMTVSVTVGVTTGQYVFGMSCMVDAWTGADTSGPIGALVQGTAASTSTLSESITPTALGSALLMFGGPTFDPTANPAAGSGCYGIHPGNAALYFLGEWAGTSSAPALTSSLSPQTMAMTFTGPQTWEYLGYEVLAAPGSASVTGAATLSGSGALTAAAAVQFTSGAVLSGSGALTAGGLVTFAPTAALSGSGSLTAQGLVTQPAAAALSGSGSLAAAATAVLEVAVALSGAGSMAPAGLVTQAAAAALSGSGTLTAAGSVQFTSAAALSGSGGLTASAAVQFSSGAVLTGAGTLTAGALVTQPAAAALSGSGSMTAGGLVQFAVSAVLSGSGSLAVSALVTQPAAAALAGTGTLTAAASVSGLAQGSAALSGSGALTAATSLVLLQAASLSGTGTLTAAAVAAQPASAALSGTGSLAVGVSVTFPASGSLSGQGSLTASAAPSSPTSAALSGTGSLAAGAVLAVAASASLSGTGVITVSVQVITPVSEPPVLWSASPAALRWKASPLRPRWTAAPSALRWRIVMAVFPPIAAVSLECVNVTWTSDLDGTSVDPTGQAENQPELTVQFAFPASSGVYSAPSEPVTWYAGSWLQGGTGRGYVSQCLVGQGGVVTLTAGLFDVWSEVTGSPESPRKFAGVLTVF